MTRAEDLHVLGLSSSDDAAEDAPRRIRKAFLRLSRTHHPDKGGSKEAFQSLSASYHRLTRRDDEAEEVVAEEEEEQPAREPHDAGEYDFWYEEHFNFFRGWDGWDDGDFDGGDEDCEEDYFASWEESTYQRRKAWSLHHRAQVRRGKDYRDKQASTGSERCMFCGVNAPISKRKAVRSGVNWEEYVKSANVEGYPGYNTCWACKDNHISVLTKGQACKKFAKVLDVRRRSSRTGLEYHPIFWNLTLAGRSFHHQPVTNLTELTHNSEYYWYPDLEREALARGWKPRGKAKENVPWKRKDGTTNSVAVTPFERARKRGRRDDEDEDDRKPTARRLMF